MNRKEPRAGKSSPAGPSQSDLFAAAVRHHQGGQLAEAERLYRGILASDPNHFDSLHLLGVVAHQLGRNDIAINLIGRAIAQNDRTAQPHYNIGLAFAALNRLDEAIGHFAKAARLEPGNAAAHLNLGNALAGRARWPEAVESYERLLRLDSRAVQAHYNLANVLMEMGRTHEAVGHYRDALAQKPDYAEALNNLGTALGKQGKLDEAAACHRQAFALRPDMVEACVNLANLARRRGALDEAEALYGQAVKIRPRYAEAYNNLGTVCMARGRHEDAAMHFAHAVTLKPDLMEGYLNLARSLIAAGDPAEALGPVRRALDIRETDEAKALFVRCLAGIEPNAKAADLRGLAIRALSEPWARPRQLAPAAARLIRLDPTIAAWIARADPARQAPPSEVSLPGPAELAALARDPLLRTLLEVTPVPDVELEQLLVGARRGLLQAAGADEHRVGDLTLNLYCAIARQCFVNEYVFACTDAELALVHRLRDRLVDSIASQSPVPALWPVAVAAYLPLHSLTGAASLIDRPWPDAIVRLLVQQIREPAEERQLRPSIRQLTAIDDAVSLATRQQYEENPYPRWMKVAPPARAWREDDRYLAGELALASADDREGGVADILVVGCGTGQQAIETAQNYPGAQVLAVDLSQASLCYAARQTRAIGVPNVEYAQADLLNIGAIGRTFDLILASGVLHHLADPFPGWRKLLALLRSRGLMQVALYSELGRRRIAAIRDIVSRRQYQPTIEDIRRCRRELLADLDEELAAELRRTTDFFSASECRDLLFHAQEHRLTLPRIGRFLAENDLTFLGFDVDARVRQLYRRRFPADRTMTDLALWHEFETENPDTFVGMYQFSIQSAR